MSDQPETGEQAWSAADRDDAAGHRDDIAGERDREAAVRDLVADQREQLADAREAELDERERRLGAPDLESSAPDLESSPSAGPGPDERDRAALWREHARQERQLDGTDRYVAATARDRAAQQRLAATPTAGTPAVGLVPSSGGRAEPDERAWTADKRDFVADQRDRIADSRDAIADARDALADEREQRADAREAELDEREQRLGALGSESGLATESKGDEREQARRVRDEARQDREQRRVARDGAAVARDQSSRQRQAATPTTGLAMTFAEIAQYLYEADSVDEVFARIAETCVAAVPSCHMASITIRHQADGFRTVASTDRAAAAADQAQYEASEGPCLIALGETALGEAVVYTPEFPDPRWPTLGSRPAGAGVHSVVSYGLAASAWPASARSASGLAGPGTLTSDPLTGSLNAYARETHAFDDAAREIGLILAAHASVALRAVGERESLEQFGRQLHAALSSRDVIGQAKGILMERLRITPDDAFDLLRRSSQRLNVKLREIAQKLTETGELGGPDRSWKRPGSST